MGWLILSIIVIGLLYFGLGFYVGEDRRGDDALKWGKRKKQIFAIFGILLFLPAFIGNVPVNSVGILYSPFSGVNEMTLDEGLHFKSPFDKIYNISTQIQTVNVKKMTTQTGDSQYLTNVIEIKYSVDPVNAFKVFKMFKTLKGMNESIGSTTTKRIFESITTQYNIIDALGSKRNEISTKLSAQLGDEFDKYGVSFDSVTIVDSDGGKKIEAAIADEAVAKKKVETAEQELLSAQTKAKQKTVQAQADQNAAKIEAETKVINAKATADANKIIDASLTDKVLQLRLYEKWNGAPTQVVLGSNNPFVFDTNGTSGK